MPILLCFAAGTALCALVPGLITLTVLAATAILALCRSRSLFLLVLSTTLGFANAFLRSDSGAARAIAGATLVAEGVVTEVKQSESSQILTVRLDHLGPAIDSLTDVRPLTISVLHPGYSTEFEPGQRLCFSATLQPVTPELDLPDETDPAQLLLRKGIFLQTTVNDSDIISVSPPEGFNYITWLYRYRLLALLHQTSLSPSAKSLLSAALLGDTSTITADSRQLFAEAGIGHILAISGLHVAIVTMIISALTFPLLLNGHKRVRYFAVILALWTFVILTGMQPSALRAALMATIFICALLLGRKSSALNSLSLAAMVILLIEPDALTSIGFQLSVAAVASIVLIADKINPIDPQRRWTRNAVGLVTVSASAMLGTGLISVIHFHTFPVYFLLANIATSILLPAVIFCGMGVMGLSAAGISCFRLSQLTDFLCGLITGTAQSVTSLPGATVSGIYLPPWVLIPFIIFFIALIMVLERQSKRRHIALGVSLISLIIVLAIPYKTEAENRIYLARSKGHTELVFAHGASGTLHLVTTLPQEPTAVRERAEWRYGDYMLKRGLTNVKVDTIHRYHDRLVTAGLLKIGLLSGKPGQLKEQKLTHAIVCKGFRGKMHEVKNRFKPDTIIIASDVHPRRAQRYINDCKQMGQPAIWTRERAWSATYDSCEKPIVK